MIEKKRPALWAVVMAATLFLAVLYAATGMADGGACPCDDSGLKQCPWKISGIAVGKWANGKLKAAIWAHGSFPIPPGASQRPTWFVNGVNVGHAAIFFYTRRIPRGSSYLRPNAYNTVTVKFSKPPYAGTSHSRTFFYEPDKIPASGSKVF